ncbi:hypothetical protein [Paraburkholderia sediminicola]|uniref:hypothetical protein n=1 Tax=Paraburkholderia sediminicola TaxID=458836 RepID=UPI0038BC5862
MKKSLVANEAPNTMVGAVIISARWPHVSTDHPPVIRTLLCHRAEYLSYVGSANARLCWIRASQCTTHRRATQNNKYGPVTVNFELFEKYESAIRDYRGPQGDPQSASLRMHRNGDLVVYYAPLEWVNPTAKLVLVDVTPWKAQADIALTEANRALLEGAPLPKVLRRASLAAAFAGVTRERVIALLDYIGVHQWLGLSSSADLFGEAGDLLQVSFVLQFPVFKNGANFRAGWHPERDPLLRLQMRDHFGRMAKAMPEAVFIPVGAAASRGVEWLTKEGFLTKERVLHGLPHPRKEEPSHTAYFLGEKDRVDLDKDTHPDKIDAARDYLRSAVAALK